MDRGVLVDTKLNMNQRGAAVWNATSVSAALEVSSSKQVFLPLCSALAKSHLESCIQI